MALILLVTAVLLGLWTTEIRGQSQTQVTDVSYSKLLGITPPKLGRPIVVRAGFQIQDINDINDETEVFELDGVLTLTWTDTRQSFDPVSSGIDEKIYQGSHQFNEVFNGWFPQVLLVNGTGIYETHAVVLRVKPDGTITLLQSLNATAESNLNLRRYPFDRQLLEATFEVFGFDKREVTLEAGSRSGSNGSKISMPQWNVVKVTTSVRDRRTSYGGNNQVASSLVVGIVVERKSFFMLRLVMLPLALIVFLSWSVFWMERSSLGDRINISFIGILTAVGYQIVVSEVMPRISYLTLMNAFLNISFLVMCATVAVNLWVGWLDKQGRTGTGDLVDFRCRWIFPISYFGLILLAVTIVFLFY